MDRDSFDSLTASALPAAGDGGALALPAAEAVVPRQRGSGGRQPWSTIAGNNPFLLIVVVQSTSD